MITRVRTLPAHPSLPQYRKQAKDLVKGWKSGDSEAEARIRTFHPRFAGERDSDAASTLADAQLALAREHGFESWPKFAGHLQALARESSPVSQFECAADAIAAGGVATLERLLRENPELNRARSTRAHRGTLLHYIGANGVEDYRQKTPPNAVAILKLLLAAGAEVDAPADMYRDDTALGLAASSIHPLLAGVQGELVETLLAAGASVDTHMVTACLANGRGHAKAVDLLASRVPRFNLEAAAGVGRLDVVRTYLDEQGALRPDATREQMQSGLNWASEYGRIGVIEFLLERGADPAAQDGFGQTALHWAAIGGQLEAAGILLKHHAPLETRNRFGGTVLGQAVWSALHDKLGIDYLPVIEALLAAGADSAAVTLPTGNPRIDDALRRPRLNTR
jgi:ankyrin repeat protein